jgi:hypothetical protein
LADGWRPCLRPPPLTARGTVTLASPAMTWQWHASGAASAGSCEGGGQGEVLRERSVSRGAKLRGAGANGAGGGGPFAAGGARGMGKLPRSGRKRWRQRVDRAGMAAVAEGAEDEAAPRDGAGKQLVSRACRMGCAPVFLRRVAVKQAMIRSGHVLECTAGLWGLRWEERRLRDSVGSADSAEERGPEGAVVKGGPSSHRASLLQLCRWQTACSVALLWQSGRQRRPGGKLPRHGTSPPRPCFALPKLRI